jgi:hypothetical protein
VDSTLLARAAKDALGDRAVLVTADSETYPARELQEARQLATLVGLRTRSSAPRSWPTPSTRATAPTAASSARTSCSDGYGPSPSARAPARWCTAPPWTISAITGRA